LRERGSEVKRKEGRWEVGEREVRGLKKLLVRLLAYLGFYLGFLFYVLRRQVTQPNALSTPPPPTPPHLWKQTIPRLSGSSSSRRYSRNIKLLTTI
jgi:hypothetical protein